MGIFLRSIESDGKYLFYLFYDPLETYSRYDFLL